MADPNKDKIQKPNPKSADHIKGPVYPSPTQPGPQYERDLNLNYNSSDLDFAQWYNSVGNIDVTALHTRSDSDSGPHAQHHTLGYGRNQASPGDHIHDGKTSKLTGNGSGLVISGSKGGNAALASIIAMLHNVISFTDNTT